MNKVVFIDRKKMQLYAFLAVAVILAGAYIGWQQSKPASSAPAPAAASSEGTQVRQLVTGEFTTTLDGKQLESYRWDPGTVIVKKGVPVELRITGVNGQSHPFVIEGLDISGEVHKGKTTVVRFTPKTAGTYAIICETHNDPSEGIPMVGYLVVQ
ncbi:cupredoxin domain-containing protein [Cohnella caldifontis]|uniref:cupredoxin domain-containing protein n=1 Tax=Cohnella caldifontis TaxID=3027471 RepID=UPI0023EDB5A7|nr:cupredoxin domain-containing protein [Cohnella sp. YIM B05605]